MKNKQYFKKLTEDDIKYLLKNIYPDYICSDCGEKGVYAGCCETIYDEEKEIECILTFDVFCKECGRFLDKWDGAGFINNSRK